MTAPTPALLADRTMRARRQSLCPSCRQPIQVGQSISRIGSWMHTQCAIERRRDALAAAAEALAASTQDDPAPGEAAQKGTT